MALSNFRKPFNPVPPEKGSFPVDHYGECEKQVNAYNACLRANKMVTIWCKNELDTYLRCRVERNLLSKQDYSSLHLDHHLEESRSMVNPESAPSKATAAEAMPAKPKT